MGCGRVSVMKHTRVIPSRAALGVGLTGCSDDIVGEWTVDWFDGQALPVENTSDVTYSGYVYSQSTSMSGWLRVDETLTATLEIQYAYAYSYSNAYATDSSSESETYTYTGMVTKVDKARFQIRLQESDDGDALNLDCTLREEGPLDCDDREEGGVFMFSRKEG